MKMRRLVITHKFSLHRYSLSRWCPATEAIYERKKWTHAHYCPLHLQPEETNSADLLSHKTGRIHFMQSSYVPFHFIFNSVFFIYGNPQSQSRGRNSVCVWQSWATFALTCSSYDSDSIKYVLAQMPNVCKQRFRGTMTINDRTTFSERICMRVR